MKKLIRCILFLVVTYLTLACSSTWDEQNKFFIAKKGILIAEKDWTGGYTSAPKNNFAKEQGDIKPDNDGIAITVNLKTGNLWEPQIRILDGVTLGKGETYKVVVTAKFPSDGTLQIQMGNYDTHDEKTTVVRGSSDFQDFEVMFEDYPYDVDNGYVLFQCGDFGGTTILKKVQVIKP